MAYKKSTVVKGIERKQAVNPEPLKICKNCEQYDPNGLYCFFKLKGNISYSGTCKEWEKKDNVYFTAH